MQASSLYRPSGLASDSHLVSASAPIGKTSKLSTLVEDQLELTERDLWEDDAGVSHYPSATLLGHKGIFKGAQGCRILS